MLDHTGSEIDSGSDFDADIALVADQPDENSPAPALFDFDLLLPQRRGHGRGRHPLLFRSRVQTLYGSSSADTISRGLGNDTLIGGAGSDSFRFTKGDGNDAITDFNPAAGGDVINLHNYGLSATPSWRP
jgi:hypothetical protein